MQLSGPSFFIWILGLLNYRNDCSIRVETVLSKYLKFLPKANYILFQRSGLFRLMDHPWVWTTKVPLYVGPLVQTSNYSHPYTNAQLYHICILIPIISVSQYSTLEFGTAKSSIRKYYIESKVTWSVCQTQLVSQQYITNKVKLLQCLYYFILIQVPLINPLLTNASLSMMENQCYEH